MEPRLSTSKKWTPFPAELTTQMRNVFQEGFGPQLRNATLALEGRIYPNELLLSLGFNRTGQLKQPNFEISLKYEPRKDNVLKLIHILFDAMGALFDQYFQTAEDTEFPRIWEEMEFETRKLFVQYSTKNSQLEDAANALLGVKDEGLLRDEAEDDATVAELKTKLGLVDDAGDEDS